MNATKLKAIAAAFAAVEAAAAELSALFSPDGSDEADGGGDAAPAKPVRGKAAAKPAAKPAAKAQAHTEDEVRDALKELAATKGKDAMADALAEVGAGRLPDVDENDYPALMAAVAKAMEAEEDEKPAPKAKGKTKAKPKAPTYEEVEEAFKELAAGDKAAAKAVLKDAGLARLSEVDQDDDGALTELLAAIKEALEGGDDALI